MDNQKNIIPNEKSSKSCDMYIANKCVMIAIKIILSSYHLIMKQLYIVIIGDDEPSLADLWSNVARQFAAQWEHLGLKLGLQDYDIANISKDNAHNPDHSVTCCKTVLQKWLQKVSSPTWGKLADVINTLTIAQCILMIKVECIKILDTVIHKMSLL